MSFVQGGQGRTKCEEGGGGKSNSWGGASPAGGRGTLSEKIEQTRSPSKQIFQSVGRGDFRNFWSNKKASSVRREAPYLILRVSSLVFQYYVSTIFP